MPFRINILTLTHTGPPHFLPYVYQMVIGLDLYRADMCYQYTGTSPLYTLQLTSGQLRSVLYLPALRSIYQLYKMLNNSKKCQTTTGINFASLTHISQPCLRHSNASPCILYHCSRCRIYWCRCCL